MKQPVLLDIDGVIADFYYGFAKYLNNFYSCTFDLSTDPDEYNFKYWGSGIENIDIDRASKSWIVGGGFETLPTFHGAVEFVKELKKMCKVCLVTARIGDWASPLSNESKHIVVRNTVDWLNNNDIVYDELNFAANKIDFCLKNNIKVLIEDKEDTAVIATKNGIKAILIDRRYNNKINNSDVIRVFNFNGILKAVKNNICGD